MTSFPQPPLALLVLAGGRGRRLGGAKAWIDWNGRPLLLHVIDRLAALAASEVLVAARPGQLLPPGDYERVDDAVDNGGPLAGLAAGLGALAAEDSERRVAVCACDTPFADPRLYRILAAGPPADIVLPRHGDHLHPLQAVWRAGLARACAEALATGERRVRTVVERVRTRTVQGSELTRIDPDLALLNLNAPDDLRSARERAGADPRD